MIDDVTKTMHQGCFVQTAFGLFDPERSIAIFNGTDEAEEIRYGSSGLALSPLPYSATVARFGGPSNLSVGSYMYLYDYFPANLEDGFTLLPPKRYKQLMSSPGSVLPGPDGSPLIVNSNALGYAPRGQWMVVESPKRALLRVNLASFEVLPFAPSLYTAGNPYASHNAGLAITADGRYAAMASNEFHRFRVFDLKSCRPENAANPLASRDCRFNDYWDYIATQVTGSLNRIGNVRFITDEIIAFDANTSTGNESYMLSPNGIIDSLIPYLGVGDSHASGQGAWNYLPETDTGINRCHLSAHSYPRLMSSSHFTNAGQSVACSGARIDDIGNQSGTYRGQAGDQKTAAQRQNDGSEVGILHDFLPGYVSQQAFLTTYRPGVVTIQISGNDAGFKDILLSCVSPLASIWPPKLNPPDCYESYEDRLELMNTINRQYGRLVQLYRQLRQNSPSSRIYALGYSQLASLASSCSLNTPLSRGDIALTRQLVTRLNEVVKSAAQAAGINYVDIEDALAGHQLCEGSSKLAVNGITAGNDAFILGQESFHPNAFGHELIAKRVLQVTKNFAAPNQLPSSTNPPVVIEQDPMLQAPKTGRAVRNVIHDTISKSSFATRGSRLSIAIDSSYTFSPDASIIIKLGNEVIGELQTDQQGNGQGTVTIPSDSATGIQDISASSGNTTITEAIYIDSSASDYDNDGLPNSADSCPRTPNSGQDRDDDGIDDACDDSIVVSNLHSASMVTLSNNMITTSTKPTRTANTTSSNEDLDKQTESATHAAPTYNRLPTLLWYYWILLLIVGFILCIVGRFVQKS